MNKKMLKYACKAVYEDILDLTNNKIYDPEIVENNVAWVKEQAEKYNLDVSFDLERIDYAIGDLMDMIELDTKENV